jgi:hypothetical protein
MITSVMLLNKLQKRLRHPLSGELPGLREILELILAQLRML